ncbi:MAG TPA: MlaD family protein [Caulobacteraceae bacterium]|jgi:phospholipid/cholesterol/gamma-HCH transport system substrate-binding protein|nr:MlaD family protein [Caulobacteraceae bacterium]
MERNANYALVGFASLALFIGLIVFGVWLARLQFHKDYNLYDILFTGPVRGLSEGGEVHFNGIKVGEVVKIALDKADPAKVVARARITSDVPIRTDSYATLEPQGITGVSYVDITAGTTSQPLLKDSVPFGAVPILKSRSSALSNLLEGSGTVLNATVEALNRVNRVLSDDNIKHVNATLDNIEAVTTEVRKEKQLLADADKTLISLQETSQSIRQLSDSTTQLVNGDGKRTLHDLADAAEQVKEATEQARGMVARLDGPTTAFATTGLPQLTSAIVSLRNTADSLDRLVSEIEQNPQALVSKTPAKEVQVKP